MMPTPYNTAHIRSSRRYIKPRHQTVKLLLASKISSLRQSLQYTKHELSLQKGGGMCGRDGGPGMRRHRQGAEGGDADACN